MLTTKEQQLNTQQSSSSSILELNFRSKGGNVTSVGKLYRGFVNDATQKTSISSIPTKHENIIYKQFAKNVFGGATERFADLKMITPGPGQYNTQKNSPEITIINQSRTLNNSSLNTKSNSSLIPTDNLNISTVVNSSTLTEQQYYQNTKREPCIDKGFGRGERVAFGQRYKQMGPGVGDYQLGGEQKNTQMYKRTHNKRGSPFFIRSQSENTFKTIVESNILPGPGDYNLDTNKKMGIPYNSSFKSGSERSKDLIRNNFPSVGRYQVNRELSEKVSANQLGSSSMFILPKGFKKINQDSQLKIIRNFLNDKSLNTAGNVILPILEETQTFPGVGQYDLNKDSSFSTENLNKGVLQSAFVDGLKDRFGDFYDKSLEKAPLPGPTKYDTIKYGLDQVAKDSSLVNGSAFMSESKRRPYGSYDKRLGPSLNLSNYPKTKKSFLLNIDKSWV